MLLSIPMGGYKIACKRDGERDGEESSQFNFPKHDQLRLLINVELHSSMRLRSC